MKLDDLPLAYRSAPAAPLSRFLEGVESHAHGVAAEPPRLEFAELGQGGLWRVAAAPHSLRRSVAAASDRPARTFSVLLVVDGLAEVSQGGRRCELRGGDFTLLDGLQPFTAEMPGDYRKVVFQLPRQAVLARHMGIEARTALPNDVERSGNRLFRDFILSVSKSADQVGPAERLTLLSASIEMLGLVEADSPDHSRLPRLERAIAEIEMNLSDPDLSADWIARRLGLSRRHTDAIFERTGMSVSAQIWERRLLRAAAELVNPARADAKLIDVAFACGFRDPAHFSRAFRKRFGLTPSHWRASGGALVE